MCDGTVVIFLSSRDDDRCKAFSALVLALSLLFPTVRVVVVVTLETHCLFHVDVHISSFPHLVQAQLSSASSFSSCRASLAWSLVDSDISFFFAHFSIDGEKKCFGVESDFDEAVGT